MNNFEKHIKHTGASVHLSDAEKARMKSVLQSYMRFHPLPEPVTTYTVTRDWTLFLYRPIATSLVLVLVVGSGVSYAAEGALPGDALYTIKTSVNEPVKVALASTAAEKVEVEIELTERRIAEATALAADDRLDEITEAKLAIALDTHAEAAATIMEEIDEDDASAGAELSTRFETRLRAREDVLTEVRHQGKNGDSEKSVERSIRTASSRVALLRERSEVRLALAPALGGSLEEAAAPAAATITMAARAATTQEAISLTLSADMATETTETAATSGPAVERATAERMHASAENKFKTVSKKARKSEKAREDLKIAENLLEEGEDHLGDDDYAAAFFSFRAALEQSERVSVFLDSATILQKARNKNQKVESRKEKVENESQIQENRKETTEKSQEEGSGDQKDEKRNEESDDEHNTDDDGKSDTSGSSKVELEVSGGLNVSL